MRQKSLKYNIMHNMINPVFISVTEPAQFIQELTAKCFRVRKNINHMQPFSDLSHA